MANYFTREELACQHCLKAGKSIEDAYVFNDDFLGLLNHIREECGFPLPVTSGYRCQQHPIEAAKNAAGAHSTGMAVDISVSFSRAYKLLQVAFAAGVPRIGVSQKGGKRFIHLDCCSSLPSPTVWSY